MKKSTPRSTSWESVAGWYDDLLSGRDGRDTYQAKVILPNLMRILPAKKSQKILDIACGQGFFSHAYAAAGAEVLGIDVSSELIKRARNLPTKTGVAKVAKVTPAAQAAKAADAPRFEIASADKITVAENESFDAAIIVLALQNIKEMPETIKEASRVLMTGGKLVIILNHPCFRVLKGSSWGYDENAPGGAVQYRRIDRYGRAFSAEVQMSPGKQAGATTISFHRPLQDYFKALSSAGFGVIGLEEWISHKTSQAGPRAQAEDVARKEIPMFLTIVARKLV